MLTDYKIPYHWKSKGLSRALALERFRFAAKHISQTDCVLDIGCGDGFITSKLAEISKEVIGTDLSASGLKFARELANKENLSLVQGDATKLPFQDDTFDVITLFEVIEHIPEEFLRKAILDMRRVLRNRGLVIITTPNPENLLNKILRKEKVAEKHHKEYSPSELLDIFSEFETEEFSGIYLPLPPLHLFYRARYKFIYKQLIKWGKYVPELARHIAYCGKLVN